GVVFGMAGVSLIIGAEALSGFGEQLLAPLAIVAASVCYAGAAIFGKTFKDLDPVLPAAGSLICGAVILFPASLVVDQPWTLTPSRGSILALIGLSLLSTALALVIYFKLLHTLGSIGLTSQGYQRAPSRVAIEVVFLGGQL